MKPSLNKASLLSDLDAAGHKILNLPDDQPLPPVTVADGSITDVKINADAAIQQSKLALTGAIPPSFVGTTATTAAQGDLAEYVARKAQPNGYASLDSGGKVPTSQLPASAGVGTVTSVAVTTANGVSGTVANATTTPAITLILAAISPTTITISGTAGSGFIGLGAQTADPTGFTTFKLWADTTQKLSWASTATNGFKIKQGGPALTANRDYQWPDKSGVIQLDSDIPTTMVAVGTGHKGGLVVDTGASGNNTDYLARDATWKSPTTFSAPTYQPVLPSPQIFPAANTTGPRAIGLGTSGVTDTNVFYQIDSNTGPFIQTSGVTIPLPPLSIIYTYQSKAGFTNSAMSSYTNPNTS